MSANAPEPSSASLWRGDNLYQQVLNSFSRCELTEEDLTQNPQFCEFLATLSQHVNRTGLTVTLGTELENAKQELQNKRRIWLRSESLHRLLQEMIQEQCVRKQQTTVPPDENMFYETVQQCLLVAQCVKQLDPSPTTCGDQPPVLGLNAQHLLELMPPEKSVQRMKQSLPKELEKHLKKKCHSLLDYYQPEWEGESDRLKNTKLSLLSAMLDSERSRAKSLKEKNQESAIMLQQLVQKYLSELIACIQLFQSVILDHKLRVQTDLDRKNLAYFEQKCDLAMKKIKGEMLGIQLDTYTAETISAHRKIRAVLESELRSSQLEKQSVVSKLASFKILGEEFEALSEEYARLRQELETKSWALKELLHTH